VAAGGGALWTATSPRHGGACQGRGTDQRATTAAQAPWWRWGGD